MKRILLSSMLVVAVVAVTAGATKAVFSDTASIPGNTVSTGTLKLTLNHSAGKPFSITNGYPGFVSDWEYMDIYNNEHNSSLPFDARLTVTKTSGDELWPYIRLTMKTSGWDSDCSNNDAGEKVIWDSLASGFPNGVTVSDIAYWHLAVNGDDIPVGYSERICQKVGIDNSAPNDVQGKSAVFTETVDAVQD